MSAISWPEQGQYKGIIKNEAEINDVVKGIKYLHCSSAPVLKPADNSHLEFRLSFFHKALHFKHLSAFELTMLLRLSLWKSDGTAVSKQWLPFLHT